jgi:hypothetical protein
MNVYLALIGFAILMMVVYACAPKVEQFIKYLEGKGRQDGHESDRH